MTDSRDSDFENTLKVYSNVIELVMSSTEHMFVDTSQAYKAEFKKTWVELMREELESYKDEEEEEAEAETEKVGVKVEEVKKEEIPVPAAKKVKVEKKEDEDSNDSELSDDDSDLDDLIKNDDDEKDPDNVITGLTTGCKTNRGKWKGDILNCVLKRKGYPETLYSKCSCVFDQDGKK